MKFAMFAIGLGGLLLALGCCRKNGGHDRLHSEPSEETDTRKDSDKPQKEAHLKHLKPTPDYPER